MRIGPPGSLPRKRSQVFPRQSFAYLNGVSMRSELGELGAFYLVKSPSGTMSTIDFASTDPNYYKNNGYTLMQNQGGNTVPISWDVLIPPPAPPVAPPAPAGVPTPSPAQVAAQQAWVNSYPGFTNANPHWMQAQSQVGDHNSGTFRFTGSDGATYYYVPRQWGAGGGGLASMTAAQAAKLGGVPFDGGQWQPSNPQTSHDGFLFLNPPFSSPAATNPNVNYLPGTGNTVLSKGQFAVIAAAATAGIASAIASGAGAAAAAGGGAAPSGAAGAIMPGAQAAASGATGGILSTAAPAIMPGAEAVASGATGGILTGGGAAAGGAGLTTTGVISAVKTAAGLVQQAASAGGTIAKVANLVTQHSDAANALATTAQQQVDAGNVAAAQALQAQAAQNAQMAAAYQQQLQTGLLESSIGGVPLWVLLAGGGLLLVALTAALTKRK